MQPTRVELRIVAGSLRGRKIPCIVSDELRPTPQMVREALFSILGNAIPDRQFFDIFAGTGIHGMEAISRGASGAVFVEYEPKLAASISKKLREYDIERKSMIFRADAYRWAERWVPPQEPINLFLSPPFPDLQERFEQFLAFVTLLAEKSAPESVLSIQAEDNFPTDRLPGTDWDIRAYGRNRLAIWVKPHPTPPAEAPIATEATLPS